MRVNDIITEVKRQISSIERQANKARRYKEKFEVLRGLEAAYAKYQIENFDKDKAHIQRHIDELTKKRRKALQDMASLDRLIEEGSNALKEKESQINEIHSEDIKLDGQMDLTERQVSFNRERIEMIHESEGKLLEQKEVLKKTLRPATGEYRGIEKTFH